jgi:dihydroflavonol-4-reductase
MAKILVTGASGFIGSRVARQLCERGDEVKVLLRPSASRRALRGLPVEIAEGDIMIGSSVYRALMGCDRLYHVAANYKMWDRDPKKVLEPSIRGTREVLEAVRRHDGMIEKVVVTSSVAAIGSGRGDEVLDETSEWKLADSEQYVVAKRRAEEAALALADQLPIVVVNPAGVFGPGDARPTPSGQLIVRYLTWSLPFPFPGSPGGLSVVDVDDVARGHLLAMEKGRIGERYILGGENLTITQIVRTMAEMTGLRGPGREPPKSLAVMLGWAMETWARIGGGEPEVTHKMARDFFDGNFWVKSDKAKNELGYTYRPARKTLARAIRWYLDNGYVSKHVAKIIRYDELPGRDPDPSLPHERSAVFAEG